MMNTEDRETNIKLMLIDNYEEKWIKKNPNNVVDYLNDWNLLMPLALEFGVNTNKMEDDDGIYFSATKSDLTPNYSNSFISDQPLLQYAIAHCIIKIDEDKH